MTSKPARKSRPKKKTVVRQDWPDSIPRRRSTARADAITRFVDAEDSRRLGVKSLDSLFQRLARMDFDVQERTGDVAGEEFLPDYYDRESEFVSTMPMLLS